MSDTPSQQSPNKKDVPRGIRLLIRAWGTFSALCMGLTGIIVMITFTPVCLGMGIYMLTTAVFLLPLEAPVLCAYFPTLVKGSDWIEDHCKFWMRALLYLAFSLPPFFLCSELSTFIGSASVLVTAVLYGVLAIGRKGADANKQNEDVEMKTKLVNKEGEPNEETGM